MKIGYACIPLTTEITTNRGCILKNATEDVLKNLSRQNLEALMKLLLHNISNNIYMFRISSSLIPFASHEVNTTRWWEDNEDLLLEIGTIVKSNHMRVSMHVGPYTIINSNRDEVIDSSIKDLIYHCRVLDSMLLDSEHKIIIHVGGRYGNYKEAADRFINNYKKLPQNIKDRLILENDERNFNIDEVMEISQKAEIPVVFDNLHNQINQGHLRTDIKAIMNMVKETWKEKDGIPKVHYSDQEIFSNKKGAHSSTIYSKNFLEYAKTINDMGLDIDIMLEVKDKDISAIKCINLLKKDISKKDIEREWARYKYLVMEHSYNYYSNIKKSIGENGLSKEKEAVAEFYEMVEAAILSPYDQGNFINAAQHVGGYFKHDKKFTEQLSNKIQALKGGMSRPELVKKLIYTKNLKAKNEYLSDSYYFSTLFL